MYEEPCNMRSKRKQDLMVEWEWNAKCEEMTNRHKLSNFLSCIKQLKNPVEKKTYIEKSFKSLEDFIDALKLQQTYGVCPTLYLPDKSIEFSSDYNDYPHYEMLLALLKKNLNTNRTQKTIRQIALAEILCSPYVSKDEVASVRKLYGKNSEKNYSSGQSEVLDWYKKTSWDNGSAFKYCLIDYLQAFDVLTEDFNLTPEQLRVVLDKWSNKIKIILADPKNEKHIENYRESVNEIQAKLRTPLK